MCTSIRSPAPRLYIVGAGHVGWHLGRLAETGFRVHVIDDRESLPTASASPTRKRLPSGPSAVAAPADSTHRVRGNRRARSQHDLEGGAHWPARASLSGLIGSRARRSPIRTAPEEGMRPDCFARLHAPIGLDIGAVTPAGSPSASSRS
jgi:xanthine dehydrogenase accessory factor